MAIPAIDPIPQAPSRLDDNPDDFVAKADAFAEAIAGLPAQLNAAFDAIEAVTTGVDFIGTSTTSLAIGTGAKSFTIETGKPFSVGQFVQVSVTATPANYMLGQITAYNRTTGAMTVNVTSVSGSGTFSGWTIGLSVSGAAYVTLGGPQTLTDKTLTTPILSGTASGTVAGRLGYSGGLLTYGDGTNQRTIVTIDNAQTLTNKTLTDPAIVGTVTRDVYAITDGASVVIDPRNGSIQTWTLGASRTPTVANFNSGDEILLMVTSAGFSVTWSTIGVTWIGGNAPALSASGATSIRLWKVGSSIFGESMASLPIRAITYVGGKAVAATGAISLTDLTGGSASAPSIGDLVVLALANDNAGTPPATPSGYTSVATGAANVSTRSVGLRVCYKYLTAADTSVTVSALVVGIHVYRGVHSTTILDVAATVANTPGTVLANPPAISPATSGGQLVVVGAGVHTDSLFRTYALPGMDNGLSAANNSTNDHVLGIGGINSPIGTPDPAAFTLSITDSTNYASTAITLVLRAA